MVNFSLAKKYKNYIIEKGSVSINGVSLTITKILNKGFQIAVIPQSLKFTNLIKLKINDSVNIEFDILGKYIKKIIK